MTDELKEKIDNFMLTHGKVVVEWIRLNLERIDNDYWEYADPNDAHAWALSQKCFSCRKNMQAFEEKADKNILLTYLKYHNDDNQRVRYPWSFNYQEPERDLVLNPYCNSHQNNVSYIQP